MTKLREALEAALVEDPDDLAAHMAYADYLHEQGDPRGELIQVQLALESEGLPKEERARLKAREKELLGRTREACLGPELARALDRKGYAQPISTIRRGWLDSVETYGVLEAEVALALADAPQARLLRRLAATYVLSALYEQGGEDDALVALAESPYLLNLRVLHLGTTDGFRDPQSEAIVYNSRADLYVAGDLLWGWLARLPRLRELYLECRTTNTARLFELPLGELRLLQVNLTDEYPLDVLARNPALRNLTHLSLHPLAAERDGGSGPYLTGQHLAALCRSENLPALTHLRFQRSDAGDAGVAVLIDSGMLRRLTYLDLAMGTITDAGAERIARADLGNLEVLDLSQNALSLAGLRGLEAALQKRFTLRAGDLDTGGHRDWLYAGEME